METTTKKMKKKNKKQHKLRGVSRRISVDVYTYIYDITIFHERAVLQTQTIQR